MASYERVNWKNSPSTETPINDVNLNIMDEGIEQAHNGENILVFESYDNAEAHETILEVPSITTGEKLSAILSKLTKFTNNIRYIIEALALEKMYEAGYGSVGEALAQLKASSTYSEEEICTGETWIDGKPIYRKTFVFTDALSSPTTEIPHNIENVEKIWVDTSNSYFHQGSSYYPVTYAQYPSGLDAVTTLASTVNMVFNVQTSWGTAWQKVITLRYTKTTD